MPVSYTHLAIKKDSQTIGMLAIENTIAGSLLHNNELLRQSGAQIVGEYKPVSYTHLDVYKRQPLHLVGEKCTYCPPLLPQHLEIEKEKIIYKMTHKWNYQPITPEPVSYTHLSNETTCGIHRLNHKKGLHSSNADKKHSPNTNQMQS